MRRRGLLAGLLATPAARAEAISVLNVFVPANPGGGWDGLGRAIEQLAVSGGLVQRCAFENLAGAGGTLGLARFVATKRGRADSVLVSGATMVGAILTNHTPVTLVDVQPVARLTEEAGVIVVPADSRFQTIGQLAEALRADPRATPVAGAAGGSIDHLILGLMLRALGREAKEASFVAFPGGGPAQAAILGSQVAASISGWGEFAEQVKAGRLRALATSGETRSDPAVPTLKESGLDVVMTNWRGVFAPAGLASPALQRLVVLMQALHALPAWGALLAERGWNDAFLAGEDFHRFLTRDQASTAGVLRDLGLA
jgi:putative tricarboxylic transport membrane protein